MSVTKLAFVVVIVLICYAHPVHADTLDDIGSCESGGDYAAIDPSFTYFGKYQFDWPTWRAMGGTTRPDLASPEEQDYRASALLQSYGRTPWPNC